MAAGDLGSLRVGKGRMFLFLFFSFMFLVALHQPGNREKRLDLEVWGFGGDGITEDLSWRCKQVLHPISGNSQTARSIWKKSKEAVSVNR